MPPQATEVPPPANGRRAAWVVVDRDGATLLCAGEWQALTGHAPASLVRRSVEVIVPPDYRERHWKGFRRAMASPEPLSPGPVSLPVLLADGTVRRFPALLNIVRDPWGMPLGAAGTVVEPSPEDPPLFEV